MFLLKRKKKLFVNKNTSAKLFHLEHDPPTIQVVNSILSEKSITGEEIEKKLKPYRLCFITVKEDNILNKNKFRSKRPTKPPYAYDICKINVTKVNND